MAEPARKLDDDYGEDRTPAWKPEVLEGGGESTPERGDLKAVDGAGEQEKNLLDTSDSGGRSRFNIRGKVTRKRLLGGGIAGLLVGGGFGLFTILQGPLQFIHIAQLLAGFHFGISEETSNVRTSRLLRYMRDGRAEKLRMGVLGNKIAGHYEDVLNRNGITSTYGKLGGSFSGFDIDPTIASEDGKYAGKSLEDIDSELKRNFDNVTTERIVDANGKTVLRVNTTEKGFFKQRNFFGSVLQDVGLDKTNAAMGKRILARRAGFVSMFHPMRKLDQKGLTAVDAKYTEWKNAREARISGEDVVIRGTAEPKQKFNPDGSPALDPGGNPIFEIDPGAAAIAGETPALNGEGLPEVAGEGKLKTKLKSFNQKPGVRVGGLGAFAIATLCVIQSAAEQFDNIVYAKVALPLINIGMEMVGLGSQVMSGQVDLEQLGFYARNLYDKVFGSWASAKSIQAELGQEQTGPDIPEEAKLSKDQNAVMKILGKIPGLGQVCNAVGSIPGQVALFGFNVISSGGILGPLAGEGLFRFLGPKLLDSTLNWVTGHPINTEAVGADFGNYMNYGVRLASNESALSTGGRILQPEEAAALKNDLNKTRHASFKSRNLVQRLFSIDTQHSLISKILDSSETPRAYNNPVSYLASMPSKLVSGISSGMNSLFSPNAFAVGTYDYGFPLIGFAEAEMANDYYENPYENADRIEAYLTDPKTKDPIKNLTQSCFKNTLSDDGTVTFNNAQSENIYISAPKNCVNPPPDIDPNGRMLQDLRFYLLDLQNAEAMACYAGDEDSCTQIGL